MLSRTPLDAVRIGCGAEEFEAHGRWIEVDTAGITVASVYVPTGEAQTERQLEKERFLDAVAARMAQLRAGDREALVCGDWNIGHTENDIKNWKGNVKKAGFLPEERQWVSDLLGTGWVDAVRSVHGDVPGPYSWWSWRGKAFDNDAGWRIDYHLVTSGLAQRAVTGGTERPGRTRCGGPTTRR